MGKAKISDLSSEELAKRSIKRKLAALYLSAFGIGVFGMTGLMFFFELYALSVFHEGWKYPYLYPFSKVMIIASFASFVASIVIWIMSLSKVDSKVKNFLLSIPTVIVGSIAGYFLCLAAVAIGHLF